MRGRAPRSVQVNLAARLVAADLVDAHHARHLREEPGAIQQRARRLDAAVRERRDGDARVGEPAERGRDVGRRVQRLEAIEDRLDRGAVDGPASLSEEHLERAARNLPERTERAARVERERVAQDAREPGVEIDGREPERGEARAERIEREERLDDVEDHRGGAGHGGGLRAFRRARNARAGRRPAGRPGTLTARGGTAKRQACRPPRSPSRAAPSTAPGSRRSRRSPRASASARRASSSSPSRCRSPAG